MRGDVVPDSDHISRYCAPKSVVHGRIQSSAFLLRKDDQSLSVNWLEFLECGSRTAEIDQIRKVYAEKLNIGASAILAVLNVGKVKHIVSAESPDRRALRVLHEPSVPDPSHSGIYDLLPDNELLAELIIQTIQESYPARI